MFGAGRSRPCDRHPRPLDPGQVGDSLLEVRSQPWARNELINAIRHDLWRYLTSAATVEPARSRELRSLEGC